MQGFAKGRNLLKLIENKTPVTWRTEVIGHGHPQFVGPSGVPIKENLGGLNVGVAWDGEQVTIDPSYANSTPGVLTRRYDYSVDGKRGSCDSRRPVEPIYTVRKLSPTSVEVLASWGFPFAPNDACVKPEDLGAIVPTLDKKWS